MIPSAATAPTVATGLRLPFIAQLFPRSVAMSLQDEYSAATRGLAVYDASHWGRIAISGADHLDFLHRMSTNDILGLAPRRGLQTAFCDHRGRLVAVVEFCRLDETESIGFVAPGWGAALLEWLEHYRFSEAIAWRDATADGGQLEVVGAQVEPVAAATLGLSLCGIDTLGLVECPLPLRVCRVDAEGSSRLRIWGPGPDLDAMRRLLLDAGASNLSEETWEILRIEQGRPLAGRELTLDHNPWEARLAEAIDLNKGCYVGQEVVARLDTYRKVKRHLVGLALEAAAAPEAPVEVEGHPAGAVTSVCCSPALGWLALAYMRAAYGTPGLAVTVASAKGPVAGVVHRLPFCAT